jgi:hypothetical protein
VSRERARTWLTVVEVIAFGICAHCPFRDNAVCSPRDSLLAASRQWQPGPLDPLAALFSPRENDVDVDADYCF